MTCLPYVVHYISIRQQVLGVVSHLHIYTMSSQEPSSLLYECTKNLELILELTFLYS